MDVVKNHFALESIATHAREAMICLDANGRIVSWNPAAENLYGLSLKEATGKNLAELILPADEHARFSLHWAWFLGNGKENGRNALKRPEGGRTLIIDTCCKAGFRISSEVLLIPSTTEVLAILTRSDDGTVDTTPISSEPELSQAVRQETQEVLDELIFQREALFNTIPGLVWIKDRDCRIIDANDVFAQGCEIPRDALPGKTDYEIWPEEVADMFFKADSLLMETGERMQTEDIRQDSDGSLRCYESVKTPIRNRDGEVVGMVGVAREITDRKRLEETLQGTNDGIWDWNLLNDRLYLNDCFLKTLEIPENAYQGVQLTIQTFFDLMHPDDRARVLNQLHAYLADPSGRYKEESRMLKRNGGYCYCVIKGEVLRNKDGRPIRMTGIISDITEQKLMEEALHMAHQDLVAVNEQLSQELSERERLENQLVQAQKMESIGQLAAGIAHEINNPVGFVQSNMTTLQEYVAIFKHLMLLYGRLMNLVPEDGASAEAADLLKEIRTMIQNENLSYILDDANCLVMECLDGLNRVKEIVHGLKTFARIDESDLKETNINECLESTLKIVWNELKYKCIVHKALNPLPLISCHPGQINQVFMNLLVNAAHAIQDKGEIHIRTFAEPHQIRIEIADTGSGIEPNIIKNIFNPFFTTKPVGKGTGLGLSISYGIIQKHCGKIEVESEINVGTTFRITLPLHGGIQNSASLIPTPDQMGAGS